MDIGSQIRLVREEKGISQEDLAAALGISPAAISLYESGRRTPNAIVFIDIASALGASCEELIPPTLLDSKPVVQDARKQLKKTLETYGLPPEGVKHTLRLVDLWLENAS